MRHNWVLPSIWAIINASNYLAVGIMPTYSPNHCRLSLTSSLWLSAEYESHFEMSSTNDFLPFAVYNQEPEVGEEEALGVPGLVFDSERTGGGAMSDYTAYVSYKDQPGFMKCSYRTFCYTREVRALKKVNKLNPQLPVIPEWPGYSDPMPFSSYVPSLLTYFRTGDGFGCIVMSLANGITLKEYTKSLSSLQKDVELRDVVRQLLISLAYLHRSEWVHGDLKPDNVMVQVTPPRTDGKSRVQVTLIDFNLAFPTINGTSPPAGHTVGYTPPEFYGSKQTVSHSFDSWSLGATLYALFTGHAPYEIDYDEKGTTGVWSLEKRKEFMRSMLKHQQHSYQQLNCSEEAREFIETLMVIDPAKRVTVEEIMWHKWLK